jgi:hypothetical protein
MSNSEKHRAEMQRRRARQNALQPGELTRNPPSLPRVPKARNVPNTPKQRAAKLRRRIMRKQPLVSGLRP